jgi:hypothetical protein
MSQERNKILDKAKKLKELSERGVGGEKENAKIMLDKYIIKHDIKDSELINHNSSNLKYNDLTDEQFLELIIMEFIPIGFASLLSRFGNDEHKAKANSDAYNFLNKFMEIVQERVKK